MGDLAYWRRQAAEDAMADLLDPAEEIQQVLKGRLPRPADMEGNPLRGEVKAIWDHLVRVGKVSRRRQDGTRVTFQRINAGKASAWFAPKGTSVDLDDLRQTVNSYGFAFETPAEMLESLDLSLRGFPQHPETALGTADRGPEMVGGVGESWAMGEGKVLGERIELATAKPIVTASTAEWKSLTGGERTRKGVALAREQASAGPIINADRNHEIQIGTKPSKHWMAFSADLRKAALIGHLRELGEGAIFLRSERPDPRKAGQQNIRAFHRFGAVATIDNVDEPVLLTVREDNEGNWFYDGLVGARSGPTEALSNTPGLTSEKQGSGDNQRGQSQRLKKLLEVNTSLVVEDAFGVTHSITPAQDAAYLAAVESDDIETAQRMVDEAAKAAGYRTGPVYHGTDSGEFTIFDKERQSPRSHYRPGFFFADSEEKAITYGSRVISAFLRTETGILEKRKTGQAVDHIHDKGRGIWIVFDPSQIKSADPFTFDEDGAVIPLSQRFNPADDRISYALRFGQPRYAAALEAAFAKKMEGGTEAKVAELSKGKAALRRYHDEFRAKMAKLDLRDDDVLNVQQSAITRVVNEVERVGHMLPPKLRGKYLTPGLLNDALSKKTDRGRLNVVLRAIDKAEAILS